MVAGGDAAKLGIGIVTDERMKETYDFMVARSCSTRPRSTLKKTYTTEFVKDLKVLP